MVKENNVTLSLSKGMQQTEIGLIPEDWEVKKISEISSIKTGGKNTQDRIENGQYPFIVRSQTVERINSYSFDGEAVLTAGDGVGVGKVFHYLNGKFDYHQRVYSISHFDKDVSGFYFFKYFQSNFFNRIMQMTAKSSVDSVRMETISEMQIPLPPLPEQQAIAKALSDADAWIESLEDLIAKKRLIKQGAMQELLTPKEGWEVKKLGDFNFDISDGNYSAKYPKSSEFKDSGIPFIRAVNIKNYKVCNNDLRFISNELHDELLKGHLKKGDVLITNRGEIGQLALVSDDFVGSNINAQIVRINTQQTLNNKYFLYWLSTDSTQNDIMDLQTGSALKQLPVNNLKKIKIRFPNITEQTRIATILSDMDTEIEQLEQKLTKARQLKQGMMQELLTGRVRLV